MGSEYSRTLGARLRAIRQQQKLSLQGVEEKSSGTWKAVVVGSYERGDRAITVAKLAALASFYGVPVVELLPEGTARSSTAPPPRVVLDLAKLAELPKESSQPLQRFTAAIQAQRGDYNGRILSIRHEDLQNLALMYDMHPGQFAEELISWGVLNPGARPTTQDAVPAPTPPVQRDASSIDVRSAPDAVQPNG